MMCTTTIRRFVGAMLGNAFLLAVALSPAGTAGASEFDEFGFKEVSAAESTSVAGAHPDVTTRFELNSKENSEFPGALFSAGRAEDISIELPPGLVGNPNVVPRCTTGQFLKDFNCPVASQVGTVTVLLSGNTPGQTFTEPLYNLTPPHGRDAVARLGFPAAFFPTFVDITVRTGSDYGLTATVHQASGQAPLVSATTVLWGMPASPIHDEQRLTALEAIICGGSGTACFVGSRPSGLKPKPFMSNPTACQDQEVRFSATSYQLPGQIFRAAAPLPPITECEDVSFEPEFKAVPTSRQAGSPTGLRAVLRIPQNEAVNVPATSAMRDAKIVLPEGMTLSASAADGLEACSSEQVALGLEVDSACPDTSKLGTARIVSPALPEAIEGAIYQRTSEPGHLFRLWLVTDEFGLHLKLPGEIVSDKQTGRLTAEFNEMPQLPVAEIELNFNEGPHAPLKNPDACGTYDTAYEFTPWSGNPPVTGSSQMTIDQGCGMGGFNPGLSAGVADPVAGAFSSLVVDITRQDGDDNIGSFDVNLPPGLLAKLKGVPLCPDAAAVTGACPAGSQIGSLSVATGAGSEPLWLPQPGKEPTGIYLAGPYMGAPNSVVTKVPAQAGPFDLGTVVVRAAVAVDPDTARVSVKTDPLPQILEGVPILYRTVHADVDRKHFAIAPTSCKAMTINSTVASVDGAVAHPSDRFQVGECAALRFKPKLTLKLKGGSARGDYPALTVRLKTHKNEANIRKISVALPHSEFLAQEHLNTICTRVQFAADDCPKGSIYGYAKAVTPLLAKPLSGPVYLRSSSHKLPDLVAALHGQFDINLSGRIDSVNDGIRTTFNSVPDAPVSKFVLKMKGGKKSLLVNSEDLCESVQRATVKMDGQNGKFHDSRPLLRARCSG
jgi:hypothetical protein